MASKLGELLRRERGSRFSGREREIQLFQRLLTEEKQPFFLLYVHGPGGQGKTTLLEKYREICSQGGTLHVSLDGRDTVPTPQTFVGELNRQVPAGHHDDFLGWLESLADERVVIFIDNYEMLQPVDNWIRREFLPRLTDTTRVVFSGRRPPSEGFINDPGWKTLMRSINLRNFDAEEARSFLAKRQLPEPYHERIITMTHGHPLALSVVADTFDQHEGPDFNPEDSTDILRSLFERFVQEISGAKFRIALEACALVHHTTESMLQAVLGDDDVTAYFDWLRQLSFIEESKWGLAPSELAREAILAELRWRNPDRFTELHEKAGNYYKHKLVDLSGEPQRRALYDLIYLHRSNPAVKPFFNWEDITSFWVDAYRPADTADIRAMAAQHEGPDSADTIEAWIQHPATQTFVWRDENRKAVAFVLRIDLDRIPAAEAIADPVVAALRQYQQKNLPLRSGEHMALFRAWMSASSYQGVSPVQSSIFLNIVQYYFTPGLAISGFCCAFPDFWKPFLAYGELQHAPDLDFQSGDKPQGWFFHDWRKCPPVAWLELLAKKEIEAVSGLEAPADLPKPAVLALSEAEFENAVAEALKNWHLAKDFDQNPLLRSNLVVKQVGLGEPAARRFAYLKERLQSALQDLEASPLDNKYYRVLYRSFFNPVGSQERTAEFLNMSFSTYRRYLKSGIERLAFRLWQEEMTP
ncbi:MAG: ATP-binding protein [Saprospiraceae bacterium]|nr:ATP-binding protein [Saprospiraceae bacterium]